MESNGKFLKIRSPQNCMKHFLVKTEHQKIQGMLGGGSIQRVTLQRPGLQTGLQGSQPLLRAYLGHPWGSPSAPNEVRPLGFPLPAEKRNGFLILAINISGEVTDI